MTDHARLGDGTAILYDVVRWDRTEKALRGRSIRARRHRPLPAINWRAPRRTRSEGDAAIARTLEDTTFYSRSIIRTWLPGETVIAMHERLTLDRFRRPGVQMLPPLRTPRRR